MKSYDKLLGAFLGVATGDALGAALEFMSAQEIQRKHGLVREKIGGGWLRVKPGEITDDTQMSLAVAEGIAEAPDDPIPAIGRRFIAWYDSSPKDIGNCCRAVLSQAKAARTDTTEEWLKVAHRVHEATGGQTAGNGALMRTIYPALWYNESAGEIAGQIGRMTHYHPHSDRLVVAYTTAVADLVRHNYAPAEAKKVLASHMEAVSDLLDVDLPIPDGYAPHSLICALKGTYETDSFEEALIAVVNLGGDTDTIGAIAGGLAGAIYGAKALPAKWLEQLDKTAVADITRLAKAAMENN